MPKIYKINAVFLTSEHTKLDVLIIEDEIDICYLLSSILKKKSFNTSYVMSISAAKKILHEQTVDLLFLDNHLPDGFGVDLISFIKKISPHTKIVMISAHDTLEDRNKALSYGADYFIGKPFTSDIINKAVDGLLPITIQ